VIKTRLLISLFCSLLVAAAQGQSYKNLVFEGAGIRGVAYVGALKELESQKILTQIERAGGTSAGAIMALCVALGYTSSEIEKIMYETKLQKFNDGKFFFIGGISRMNRHYGWYQGKKFLRWLEKIIADKTGNGEITFREMQERKFPGLYVTGTSLNHQKLIVFSNETYPNMKVKDAVRISVSIPLYFKAVFIDSVGQVSKRKDFSEQMDIMVDGGLTGNFPIFIFDSVSVVDGRGFRIPNPQTIGLRIDTPEQITFDTQGKGLAPINITRFRNYVGAFYNYVIENLNRNELTPMDWARTVSISSGSVGPKIRRLASEEKNGLVQNGQAAMRKFLELHDR
jgi:NTE family protein